MVIAKKGMDYMDMLYSFTSTRQNFAMHRFSKYLVYCNFNPRDEVLIHNPG